MRRSTVAALSTIAAVLAAASLAACSSSSSPSSGGSGGGASGDGSGGLKSASLKLVSLASDKPGLDQAIADWSKIHPDIKIQAQYYPSGDPYTTTVTTQFAGGNGADLVWLTAGNGSQTATQPFARAGYLADLSDQSWVSSMYGPTKPLFEQDGKVYVRDLGLSPLAIMNYNKDYFTQNNLQIPTTFPQLLTLCQTISAKGMTPISWGAATQPVNANNTAVIAGNTVFSTDANWLTTAKTQKTPFTTSAGWREAVQEVQDMKNAKCFSPGAGGVALTQMISDFANKQTAMMFTYGGLDGNVLQQTPSLNIGMFPLPAPQTANTRVTVQAAGGLGINAKSSHKAQAEAFLDFLSTAPEQQVLATKNNLISSGQAVSGDLTGIYADIKTYFTGNLVLADPTAQWPNTSFNTNTGASLQGLFTGQKSVDAVLKDMDKFWTAS